MTNIEQQIRSAQRRLWTNRWLGQWGWSLLAAAAAWTLLWLADRLLALKLPMGWAALMGLTGSLVVSGIWLLLTRDSLARAAVVLDEAAALRERLSSSLYAQGRAADPFAQAVVADAENSVQGLSARRFIPIGWSGSLSLSAAMLAIAALSLLLPQFDLLGAKQAQASDAQRLDRIRQSQTVLAKPISSLQEIAEKNPELDAAKDMAALENALKREESFDPAVVRREAVKKLDRLQDALKQKADSERYQALNEAKKRLEQAGRLADPKTELGKLMDNLASGDFDQAQKTIEQVKEQLAKRAKAGGVDAKQAAQMRKQLDEMSRKLSQAAEDKQSEQELKNKGLSAEDAKRTLDALAKKDPKQAEKAAQELAERLKKQGMSEQQVKDLVKKIQQRQQACDKLGQMASKTAQAGKKMEEGQNEAAADELGQAAEMLDEMEQMEQSLNDIQSQMAQLNDTRDQLGDQESNDGVCKYCNGSGFRKDGAPCPHCNGTGRGPGQGQGNNKGRGFGARGRDDAAKTQTVDAKAKVKTSKDGRIIGQQFVRGRQLKGQSQVELQDAAAAAEIDAADALDKDRVPRIYRNAVRKYFDRLDEDVKSTADKQGAKPDRDAKDAAAGESADEPGESESKEE